MWVQSGANVFYFDASLQVYSYSCCLPMEYFSWLVFVKSQDTFSSDKILQIFCCKRDNNSTKYSKKVFCNGIEAFQGCHGFARGSFCCKF